MSMSLIMFIFSCICGLVASFLMLFITSLLSDQGIDVNFLSIRWNTWKCLKIYKKLMAANGKKPYLYYFFLIFSLMMILFFIEAVVLKIGMMA